MRHIIIASLILTIASLPSFSQGIAVKDFSCDGIKYTDFGHIVAGLESNDITKAVIPSVVTYGGGEAPVYGILVDAFRDCPNLESLTISGSIQNFMSEYGQQTGHPFSGTPSLKELILEYGEEPIRLPYPFVENDWNLSNLTINRKFLTNDIVNDGNGNSHWEDFPVFEGLKADTVSLLWGNEPNTMQSLTDYLFQKSAINTLKVGAGLESLGVNTFIDMQQPIRNLVIEDSEQELLLYTTIITSSGGMISTASYPSFDESAISQLEYIYWGRQLKDLEKTKLFANVKEVKVGPEIKEIQPNMFSDSNIETILFNDGIETIGVGAFSGCQKLKEVSLPSGIKEIASCLFTDCKSLTTVMIPLGITSIGSEAFMNCKSLKALELPESLTSIGPICFNGSGLTSVDIPENVESIGMWAFDRCSLEYVRVFRETPLDENQVSPDAFNSYKTTKLIVPRASMEKYEETSPWSLFETIVSQPWIKCTPADLLLTVGEKKTLSFEVMDAFYKGYTFRCESDNENIFSIEPDTNEITAISEGTALLKVTADHEGWYEITETFLVTVIADSGVDSIVFDKDEIVTVFNPNGVKIGEYRYCDLRLSLPSGLYILRSSDGKVTKAIFR